MRGGRRTEKPNFDVVVFFNGCFSLRLLTTLLPRGKKKDSAYTVKDNQQELGLSF